MKHLAAVALVSLALAGCQDPGPFSLHGPPDVPGQPTDPGPPPDPGRPDNAGRPDDPGKPPGFPGRCEFNLYKGDTFGPIRADGGGNSFPVGASEENCPINVSSNDAWLTIDDAYIVADTNYPDRTSLPYVIVVVYSADPNPGAARSGTINTDAGLVTITQAGT